MMSPFSLLATPLPTVKDGEAVPAMLEHASAPREGGESFISVMSHARGKASPKLPADAKSPTGQDLRTPAAKPLVEDPADVAAQNASAAVASALTAVMAQLHPAARDLPKPLPAQSVNSKNSPPAKKPATDVPTALPGNAKPEPSTEPETPDISVTGALMLMLAQPQTVAIEAGKRAPVSGTARGDDSLVPVDIKSSAPAKSQVAQAQTQLLQTVQPRMAGAELRKPAVTQPSTPTTSPKTAPEKSAIPTALATVSINKPEPTETGLKPVDGLKLVDPHPVDNAEAPSKPSEFHPFQAPIPVKEQSANPAETAASRLQPIAASAVNTQQMGPISAVRGDGTGGALSTQTMNSGVEKNEFAGGAAQKAPAAAIQGGTAPLAVASARGVLPSATANNSAGGSASNNFGPKQDPITTSSQNIEWPVKLNGANLDASKAMAAAQPVDQSASQADRLGHLLTQQVVMVRQSGANNLAVSLKLDPQTELSLQLTNHNGQIEAAVRWERGDITGLNGHWKDLQESLARQNVQLLPLENKPAARTPSYNSPSDTASSFNQPRNSQRQDREPQRDSLPDTNINTIPSKSKATTRTASRQGWESWA